MKKTLLEIMEKQNIMAPCVFDCASSRAVEMCGFKALMFSGAELSMASKGLPDLGLTNLDELLWAVTRITDSSTLPLVVDIEDGFGSSPLNVYHTCKRVAKAGAKGVLMEDESEPGFAKDVVKSNLITREHFIAKTKAAIKALEGTDCILISRTNAAYDLEEAVARCNIATSLGAECTAIVGIKTIEQAKFVSERVSGNKMFADINQSLGLPNVNTQELYDLGFNFVTMHYLLKAAMNGMLEWGKENFKRMDNVYSNNIETGGFKGHSAMPIFEPQKWLNFEGQFTCKTVAFHDPSKPEK